MVSLSTMSGGLPTINVLARQPFDKLRASGLIQRFPNKYVPNGTRFPAAFRCPTRLRKQGTRFLLTFHHPEAHLISMHRRAHIPTPGIAWQIIRCGSNRSLCFCAEGDSSRFFLSRAYTLGSKRFQQDVEMAPGRRTRRGQAGKPGKVSIGEASQGNLP